MEYFELAIQSSPEFQEILMAELAQLGFDMFEEGETELLAYVQEQHFEESAVKQMLESYAAENGLTYTLRRIPFTNWNAEWEQNFEPIYIGNQIQIRADFHAQMPGFDFDLVINPKMSFGTGHHATTSQMLEAMLQFSLDAKSVLDAGCGTSILAIMAAKLHASPVFAYDYDDLSVENSLENIARNACPDIQIQKGTIDTLSFPVSDFHVILANINKNVLLHDLPFYSKLQSSEGILVLSGFYVSDNLDLMQVASEYGYQLKAQSEKDNWACLTFIKN